MVARLHVRSMSIWMVIVGCGATTQPPAATATSARRALIAQPCAQAPAKQEAGEGGYGRVFIQAAQVVASDLNDPLASWLVDHAVNAPSVMSFVAARDVPTTVSWNRCLDMECTSSEPWALTVTPALPARASDAVVLTVQSRRDRDAQERKLETRNQQPVVVDLDGPADGALTLVVTPYLIGDDEDLRRLAECKSTAGGHGPRE